MNKGFILLLLIGLTISSGYGQTIVPFPDLGAQNRTNYKQQGSNPNSGDYSSYPLAYQKSLIEIDQMILEIEQSLNEAPGGTDSEALNNKKAKLILRRDQLLEEAGLLDDLSEFY